MRTLVLVLARRERVTTAVVIGLVALLTGVVPRAYSSTYATEQARRSAVEVAQRNGATTVLYGRLPDPGTPAQLYTWETGTFLVLIVAVVGALMAIRLTRAAEDAGMIELLRGSGTSRAAPLLAACAVLALTGPLLTCVAAIGLTPSLTRVEGIDAAGVLCLGATLGTTFLLAAAGSLVIAQVAPSAWASRVAAAVALASSFAIRAGADTQGVGWLNRVSPLGLRATVAPFTGDRASALAGPIVAILVLGAIALRLSGSRDLGAGMVGPTPERTRHLHVSSPTGLNWRLARATTAWWVGGVAVGGALFVAMGSGVVESARSGGIDGGFLGHALGTGDPLVGYLRYSATVLAIVVSAAGLLLAGRGPLDERGGRSELVRTAGVGAASLTARHGLVAAAGAAAALLAGSVTSGAAAALTLSGDHAGREAVQQVLRQSGAVAVLLAIGITVAALAPRRMWLAWAAYGLSTLLALGSLLGLPTALIDLGAFADGGGGRVGLLLVLGAALAAAGIAGSRHRDLVAG